MDISDFKIGQTVYHRSVYQHNEELKIVGISETHLHLEGDYSGGTNKVTQRDWLPLKGTSRIHNHAYKLESRNAAITIKALAIPCAGSKDNAYLAMIEMADRVLQLTVDVSLNPEY